MRASQVKSICNFIVLIMFIFSTIMLIRYSKLPNYFNITFFERPSNVSDIMLSLFSGFDITAIFYFIVNYIPDKIKDMEKEEQNLPYRINLQKDVFLFAHRCISLWKSIVECAAGQDVNIIKDDITEIDQLFNKDLIRNASAIIKLSDVSNVADIVGNSLSWGQTIASQLNEISERGNKIIDKYSNELPAQVYFSIYYLLNSSQLFFAFQKVIPFILASGKQNIAVENCLAKDVDGKFDILETTKSMCNICDWINSESDYLKKNANREWAGEISRINILIRAKKD